MRTLFITISFFLHIVIFNAQSINENIKYLPHPKYPELFKTVPLISNNSPKWVKLLYSKAPNYNDISIAFDKYYSNHPFKKNTHTQNYKFFIRTVYFENYVEEDGTIYIPTLAEEDKRTAFLKRKYDRIRQKQGIKTRSGNWSSIGPFETYKSDGSEYKSSQVNVYVIDQSQSNPNVMYAGTEGGALFKSIDKGLNWSPLAENLSLGGIGAIEVDPTDADIVYMAQGKRLYKSTDGGNNWNEIQNINQLNITDISINPNDHNVVLTAGNKGLQKSTDGGNSWSTIIAEKCYDIELKTDDPNTVFVAKENTTKNRTEIWKSTDNGASFTAKTNGWWEPLGGYAASNGGARIGVTDADPDRIYVMLIGNEDDNVDDNNYVGIYRSDDAAESWSTPYDGNGDGNPDNEPGGPYSNDHWCFTHFGLTTTGYNQGFYDLAIDVSDTDPDKFLVGSLNLFKSEDGGVTYTAWGGYQCQNCGSGYRHPDIQEIEMNGDDVWVTTDGGIDYYDKNFNYIESRTKGIYGSAFWGFGQGWNDDVVTGGRYHNGNGSHYEGYGQGRFLSLGGGESATGYVNQGENRKVHHSDIGSKMIPESLTGGLTNIPKYSKFPNQSYYPGQKSEIVSDPRSWNLLYLGNANVLYKSIDGGVSFDTINVFGNDDTKKMLGIEVCRSNTDYIYAVQLGNKLWKSTDGGTSWSQLNPPHTTNAMYISSSGTDENSIFLAITNGYSNSNKIFHSVDGGDTWTNLTTSIFDGEKPKGIQVQDGTDGGVYVMAGNKVFYKNNNIDWQLFSDGLPAKINYQAIVPFYRDEKIRLASENKALWESQLYESSSPVAQPMVDQLISYCSRDTLQFEDYSIRKAGASWAWTFTPAPQYINATNIRNPKVVFGDVGQYTVSLTVTNPNGQSDTKTIQNMVTVEDECDCDTIAGRAVICSNSEDYVTVPDVDILTNEITFTAWIKPNGAQNDYTGIVFNDGDANEKAGFNFRNNKIAYHWPDGAYWWNSGLEIPTDEWSYVAMVARPTGITLYVNGIGSTHSFQVPEVNFNTMKFGSYRGWSSRNLKGEMDEVCIFNTALTENEIRDIMHLTKKATDFPSLVHYYQFNRASGVITDRIGTLHASLHGNASRVKSTAPIGGGKSQRLSITSPGIYNFDKVGLKMRFGNSATLPNGDMVVSRLNVMPDTISNVVQKMYKDYYWILSNYGSNSLFTQPDSLWFNDLNFIYEEGEGAKYELLTRSENEDGLNWVSRAQPVHLYSTYTGSMLFNSSNNIIKEYQLLLIFTKEIEDIIWNGEKWRGGTGLNKSPGLNDNVKKVFVMPGLQGSILENSNVKNLKLFEDAKLKIPLGIQLETH